MTLLEFIVWVFAVYGAVNGIAFSALLSSTRNWITYSSWKIDERGQFQGTPRTNPVSKFFSKLIYCPMCLGAWIAVMISLAWKSPSGNYLVDFFLGSCTSWILYLSLHKLQFKGA